MKALLTLIAIVIGLSSTGCLWPVRHEGYGHDRGSPHGERSRGEGHERGEHRGEH